MKEIKEETVHEVKETFIYYEAYDGTRFNNLEECKKYEASALGTMRARVKCLMSEPKDAWTIMGGIEDHQVVTVCMLEKEHVDTVIQWMFIECPWYLRDDHAERKQEVVNIITEAYKQKDVLLFGINCEGDYYFINSRNNIICNLKDFG